jgi:hypothetical protein
VEIMALCSPDFAVRDSTKNALALFFCTNRNLRMSLRPCTRK